MFSFFFFNDTATTEIYTLSLHDALPIFPQFVVIARGGVGLARVPQHERLAVRQRYSSQDRKSTRLNSSHVRISYAVFCLKKQKPDLSINGTIYGVRVLTATAIQLSLDTR